MASFTNFLTQGTPQKSTSSTLNTSQVPEYLSDYLYNLMSGAYGAASEEYQPYAPREGEDPAAYERIAGFDPLQEKAFGQIEGAAGAYKPSLEEAKRTAAGAAGLDAVSAASKYLDPASASVTSNISNYLNPYQENVINRMGDMAQRQITEKLMPALGDQFIRAGQYGSTRQQELAQRGVRDIASELQANIGAQLAKGYETSAGLAAKDLERLAEIGKTTGTLTGTEEQQKAALASVQAGLGQKEQALGLQGAAALEAAGAEQQALQQKRDDLRYKDFMAQSDYPKEQLSFLSNIVRGLPSGGGTTSSATTSSGNTYSASPLAQLASAGLSAAAISNLLK